MGFLDKTSAGWQIAQNSLKVLKANKSLIVFPLLSGISITVLMTSFIIAIMGVAGWDMGNIEKPDTFFTYFIIFAFYIVNYFIVVFFNMALIHCASLYFKGEEPTVKKGIDFSMSKIGNIFTWALFAGSVGAVLKIVQQETGVIGKIITGIIGIVWNIATFFVVPVIAYENMGPIDAFKRSSSLMKEKWGQSIGASFSFGLIQLGILALIAVVSFLIGMINPIAGIAIAVLAVLLMVTVFSAAKTIFVSAVYHNVTGDPVENYDQHFIDNLFESKK